MQKLWLALLSALLGIAPAQAQNFTMPPPAGVTVGGFVVVPTCAAQSLAATQGFGTMDETGALCVNATVMATATIAGFPTVQSTGTPISVSTVSATGTLPSGTVVVASNVGATNGAYCKLGASATTSDQLIPPNSWFAFTVGANTQLSCITSTSTTTVNMVGGSGIATGSGGGGGGGSGGSVTQGTVPWVVGQSTAASLNAQVVGPGATGAALVGNPVRVALSDGTNTQNWLTALALNPTTGVNGNNTGAVVNYLYNGTAYVAAPGTLNGAYGIIRDAAGNARGANVNASSQLSVSCDNGCAAGGGVTATDQAAWTQASSPFTPAGGVFNDTATLSSGQEGTARLTTKRAAIVDVDTTGNALYTAVTSSIVAGTNRIGYTSDDVCTQKAKTTAAFSTSSGGPVAIVPVSGSTVVYVCSISAITDTAVKLSFIDGTGTACAAATHPIWGSTTAANGMSLAANGGFTQGNGGATVGSTTAASGFCLLQSGTSLVAGNITYVQQ